MKKHLFRLLLSSFLLLGNQIFAQTHHLLCKTNYGNFKILLYDYTPHHRDLILNNIKKCIYTKADFNRIVHNFVVQGGELDETILNREKQTGKYEGRLAPEFDSRAIHKLGALGAGRDPNPEKASYWDQIYFVVGAKVTVHQLDSIASAKHIHYTLAQKQAYLKNGGQPMLDQDYTVLGEVYEGLDVILKIGKLKTAKDEKPLTPVIFSLSQID